MTIRTHGLVLLKRDFREHDRIYTIYTADFGKLELLGKATRKITSKLAGHLEPPALCDLFIVRGKVFDHIANVRQPHFYNNVRSDYIRALEFAKAAVIFDKEVKLEQKDPHLYSLLFNFLQNLNSMRLNLDTVVKTPTLILPLQAGGGEEGVRENPPLQGGGGEEGVDPKIISTAFLNHLTNWTSYGKVF